MEKIDNSYYSKFLTKDEISLRNKILECETFEERSKIWHELLNPDKVIVNGKPRLNRQLTEEEVKYVKRTLCKVDRMYLVLVVSEGKEPALLKILKNQWLFDRCREVERNPDGRLDLWPRGHYKSTIVTKFGIMQELLINPKLTILLLTYTKGFAREILDYIKKQFELNEELKYLFDDILYQDPKKEAPSGTWTQRGIFLKGNAGGNAANVTYGSIEGGGKIGHHAQLLVYDDIVVAKSIDKLEKRMSTIQFINNSKNLGSPGQDINRKWFVGTRYHKDDAYNYLISQKAVIPRIYTATKNGKLDGELVLLTREEWEKDYITQDDYTVACQMFMNPTLSNKSLFDVKYLKPYDRILPMNIFIIVDPASSKKESADSTSISVVGIRKRQSTGDVYKTSEVLMKGANYNLSSKLTYNLEKYLLDGVKDKLDLNETWDKLKRLYLKWEDFLNTYGNGKYTIQVFYEQYSQQRDIEVLKQLQEKDGIYFEINRMGGNKTSKNDRIKRMIPDLKRGNVKIPHFMLRHDTIAKWKLEDYDGEIAMIFEEQDNTFNPVKRKKRFDKYEEFVDHSFDWDIQEQMCYPLIREDFQGFKYDYTSEFINEMLDFPFGKHDDCIDSFTRIYDINDVNDLIGEMKIYSN